jgi:hypothetical protein
MHCVTVSAVPWKSSEITLGEVQGCIDACWIFEPHEFGSREGPGLILDDASFDSSASSFWTTESAASATGCGEGWLREATSAGAEVFANAQLLSRVFLDGGIAPLPGRSGPMKGVCVAGDSGVVGGESGASDILRRFAPRIADGEVAGEGSGSVEDDAVDGATWTL